MKPRPTSPAVARAVALTEAGVPVLAAAKRCDVTQSAITRARQRLGLEKRKPGRPAKIKEAKA